MAPGLSGGFFINCLILKKVDNKVNKHGAIND